MSGNQAKAARRWMHFDLAPHLNCIANRDGYFVDLNRRWEDVLGTSRTELGAKPFVTLVHPDDQERTGREAVRLLELGTKAVQFTNRYACADGSYRWLQWDSSFREGHYFATARVVPQTLPRKERARQLIQGLLESATSPDAVTALHELAKLVD